MGQERMNLLFLHRYSTPRCLAMLWSLIVLLTPTYFLLMHYWPLYKAQSYFTSIALRLGNLERGCLPFFIEGQRRTVFELSRSVYMQNLITFTQGQSEITEQQVLKMELFIKSYQAYFGYKNVMLIDKEGNFVFSTKPGLRGKSIHDPAYKNGLILPSFKLALKTMTSDITPFSFSPVLEEKAVFVTMPVFFDGSLNGFLVVQLNNNEIEGLLVRTVDLGVTGEYLVVQRVRDTITFVVPPPSQPDLTLPVRPEITRDIGSPTERAALGYEGYGVSVDYRGVLVAGAWYFLPQLNWGFVCKTNYAEVTQYIRWMGYLTIFLALLSLILTAFCFWKKRQSKLYELPPSPTDTLP